MAKPKGFIKLEENLYFLEIDTSIYPQAKIRKLFGLYLEKTQGSYFDYEMDMQRYGLAWKWSIGEIDSDRSVKIISTGIEGSMSNAREAMLDRMFEMI